MPDKVFYQHAVALAAAGEALYRQGWVPATSGNFSCRLDADSAIITASGKHKGRLAATDFLAVDFAGRPLEGGTPSAETGLHTQLYLRFPAVGAVLHCHSPAATVLSRRLAEPDLILQGYEVQKALPGISSHEQRLVVPVLDNSQDIPALARAVDRVLDEHPEVCAYLIRGHGIYVWGENLERCMNYLEAMDFLLQCELLAQSGSAQTEPRGERL